MIECTHTQLEDGSIAVMCGDLVGTVSSWHLVPTKENQLKQALECQHVGVTQHGA
jgi:hypothetical protein